MKLLASPEREIKIEAVKALSSLSEESQADTIRANLASLSTGQDSSVNKAVSSAISNLDDRFSPTAIAAREDAEKFVEPAKTLLMDSKDIQEVMERQKAPSLDISTLNPGDIIEGRYKYLQKIGKGGKILIYAPAALGYGKEGQGPIPGESVLEFEVELVEFK